MATATSRKTSFCPNDVMRVAFFSCCMYSICFLTIIQGSNHQIVVIDLYAYYIILTAYYCTKCNTYKQIFPKRSDTKKKPPQKNMQPNSTIIYPKQFELITASKSHTPLGNLFYTVLIFLNSLTSNNSFNASCVAIPLTEIVPSFEIRISILLSMQERSLSKCL
jgi:hypothetical protein